MYITDEEHEKYYNLLLNTIKEVNADWISLRQSKDYRVGMVLNKVFYDLKHFKIKDLFSKIDKWKGGVKKELKFGKTNQKDNGKQETNYFSNERIAIYTSIFGNYDDLLEPYFIPDNCDFFVFTDQEIRKDSVWKKMETPKEITNMSNIDKNRYVKMLPHKFFGKYKYSIYVDGNIQIIADMTEYINYLNEIGIGIHMHHLRDCVYQEIKAVKDAKRITKRDAKEHIEHLKKENMPEHYGLLQCNVIVREHNNKKCINIMEQWWEEFKKYCKRDQVSLPYILYKNNITVNKVGVLGKNVYTNPSLRVILHK